MTQKLYTNHPDEEIKEVLSWLEGALSCKDWHWSPDQHHYAIEAYDRVAKRLRMPSYENRNQLAQSIDCDHEKRG